MTYTSTCFSQAGNINVNKKITAASFDSYSGPVKRKLLSFKKKYSRFNPLNYVGAGMLYVYQNIFSEQIQASCSYEISCSEYTKLSIQKYGFFTGVLKGFNQLSECAPNAVYEHPPLYVNSNGKIINHFEKEAK